MHTEHKPYCIANTTKKESDPFENPTSALRQFIFNRNPDTQYRRLCQTERILPLDKQSLALVLDDLKSVKAGADQIKLEQFKKDWGDAYYIFERLEGIPEANYEDTLIGEITTIAQAMMIVPRLNEAERIKLFKLIGYSSREIQDISKNIAVATIQGSILLGIAYAAVGTASYYAFQNPFLHDNPNATQELIKIHLIHLAAASIKSLQNTRMVEDTGTNTDPAQTTIHQVLLKTFPNKKNLRLALSFAVGLGPALISEIQTASVAIPLKGTSIDYARSLVGAIFDITVGIYAQSEINKRRHKESITTNQPTPSVSDHQE